MLLLPSLSRSKHIFTQNGNWEISVCRSLINKTLSFPFNGSTQMKKPKHHIHNIRCDVRRQDVMGAQLINKNAESLSFSAAFTSASVSVWVYRSPHVKFRSTKLITLACFIHTSLHFWTHWYLDFLKFNKHQYLYFNYLKISNNWVECMIRSVVVFNFPYL